LGRTLGETKPGTKLGVLWSFIETERLSNKGCQKPGHLKEHLQIGGEKKEGHGVTGGTKGMTRGKKNNEPQKKREDAEDRLVRNEGHSGQATSDL